MRGNLLHITITLLFVIVCLSNLFAQQNPIYNQYMFNPLAINPAYAGSREQMSVVALYRYQWVGIAEAPKTQTIAFHSPFYNGKVGLGLVVTNDKIGAVRRTSVSGAYAYRIRLATGKLAFGLNTSLYNYAFNWDAIEYKDGNEPLYGTTRTVGNVASFDFGMRYNTKKFYVGITALNLNNPRLKFLDTDSITSQTGLNTHVNLTAGKAFELNESYVLRPSLMVKYERGLAPLVDLNVSVLMNKVLWVGLSYRSSQSIVFIVEYNHLKKFRGGYSYDMSLNKIRTTNYGSHEIFIGYEFGTKQKPTLVSPRGVYF